MIDIFKLFLTIGVTASIMIGIVLIIRRAFSKKMSPAVILLLWGLVLIRLILPFTISSPVQISGLFPQQTYTADTNGAAAAAEDYTPGLNPISNNGSDPAYTDSDPSPGQESPNTLAETSPDGPAVTSPGGLLNNIPWWNVFAALWTAGIAATFLLFVWKAVLFKRKLRFCNPVTDKKIMEIIKVHKKETGVKKAVAVMECDFVHAPAVFGYFRPCILIPSRFIKEMDRDSLGAILLHEIYHIRCHDILTNYIWLAAKALHWFNPFVWLAYKSFEDDVELGRDQKAARTLEADGIFVYSRSLLEAARFSRQAASAPSAAAALFENKCKLRQRVFRLVKPYKKTRSAAVVSVMLAMIMVFGCFTTACQPTPEKPFVQSKTGDAVQQAIAGSPAGETAEINRYFAPETWRSEVADEAKSISINVDAQVVVPTDTWGIYQLSAIAPDKQYLDKVLKVLIGDAEIYGEDTYRSKAELQQDLAGVEEDIKRVQEMDVNPAQEDADLAASANPQASGGPIPVGDIDIEGTLAYFNELRAGIIAAMQKAPDESMTVRVDIDTDVLFENNLPSTSGNAAVSGAPSIYVLNDGGVEINGLADIGRAAPANIYLDGSKSGKINIRFRIGCGGNGGFGEREPLDGEPLDGIMISRDEAADTAKQAVLDMGFDYLGIASENKMSVYNSTKRETTECYAFTFTRSLDGVPATYAYSNGGMTMEEWDIYEAQYARQWYVSEAVIGVDDSGVIYARINAPRSDVTRLAEGIELKDFNEIMEIFNQQAVIEGCYSPYGDDERVLSKKIDVDEIRLGYMPTIWKDHEDEIIFIPVWDFFGSETDQYDSSPESVHGDLYESLDENYQRTDDLGGQSILTINAIDGTIMQRLQGSD